MEQPKKPLLVSACLLGVRCKYSGGDNFCPEVLALRDKYDLIPVCPEQLGGLPTPRPPAECYPGGVRNNLGEDVTEQFRRGAEEALKLGQLFGCKAAVLKARSPSCGFGIIYDGTFTGTKFPGYGVTAELLLKNGYQVYSEAQLEELT